MQRQGGLAGGFRTIHLDYPSTRYTTYPQGQVQRNGAGGDGLHTGQHLVIAEPHDGTLAELFLDLGKGELDGLVFIAHGVYLLGTKRDEREL